MPVLKSVQLARFSRDVLSACGVPGDDAGIITDSIVYAHLRGKGTHGASRLPIYVRKIQRGSMSAQTSLDIVQNGPVISILDAGHGFGQVAGIRGMHRAMDRAKTMGVGIVGIRHSNNLGTAGFVAEEALKAGMIGIVLANSAPAIAPTGGTKPIFGTNPLAIALPVPADQIPIVLDMAVSEAARGKIRLAGKNDEKIPLGWALDVNGNPTDDPVAALKGTMLPIGGPKGYGLALAIDILAGLLTGAAFGGDVKPLGHLDSHSNYGHFLMALNIAHFLPKEQYLAHIAILLEKTRNSGSPGSVKLPGERSFRHQVEHPDDVQLSNKVVEELRELANTLNLSESALHL